MASVLHLVDSLSSRSAGAETLVEHLAVALAGAGHDVTVVTTRVANGPPIENLERAGVRHVHIDRRGRFGLRGLIRLARVVRREKPEVLHAHMFGSNVWGSLFGRAFRVPVVVAHEQTWDHGTRHLRRAFDHLVGRLADVFIAVSQLDADFMVSAERVPPRKVVIIPNAHFTRSEAGEEGEINLPQPHGPVAAAVLVMRRQKRMDVLLRAFAVACDRVPDTVLALAGDGPERGAAEQLAHELGIAHRVRFLGYRRDVRSVWDVADVAVLSSDFEGTPLALIEAMAFGVPVVATSVGGVPDIVADGVNGVLVPPNDPERLGVALADLLADKPRRQLLGEGARATAANFDGDAYRRKIEDLYGSLLAASSRRTAGSRR